MSFKEFFNKEINEAYVVVADFTDTKGVKHKAEEVSKKIAQKDKAEEFADFLSGSKVFKNIKVKKA